MKLFELKKEWEKYLVTKDPYVVDLILATLIGNSMILRDPIWLMIIAPSSGGKSSFLAPCAGLQTVHFLDDLTEKSFLSGYKVKGKETSLLKIIGSGIMCFSDFTAILSKNPMSRNEILGQLRLVYDGSFSKRTGVGEIKWQGKMGMIGAATPDIYQILEGARSMGERFLYYWMDQPTDEEIVAKQEEVSMSSRQIAEAMHPYYQEYVNSVQEYAQKNGIPALKVTPEQLAEVNRAAIFCVTAKATVHLDFKTGKPDALVNKPGVGRDRKMFQTLLHALQLMNAHERGVDMGVTSDMVDIIKRCAWSSVSRERRKILEVLTSYDMRLTASQIGAMEDFGLQKEAMERYLWVLHAVGLVQKDTSGNAHKWYIESEATKAFVRSVGDARKVATLPVIEEEKMDEALNNF